MQLHDLPRLRSKTTFLLMAFALITLIVGGVSYFALVQSQSRIIEHEAIRIAEVVTNQALSSRTVFASAVAKKLENDGFGFDENFHDRQGYVPIPAQYLKFVAKEVSGTNRGLYSYSPLSRFNLADGQGLTDDFRRWGWQQLELQDRENPSGPIDWQPVWRYEVLNGIRTLRYMSADPAAADNCVECHNEHERRPEIIAKRIQAHLPPGKQLKLHQLLGALEVNVPVDRIEEIAASHANTTLTIVLAAALTGMGLAGYLAFRDIRRERAASVYFEQQARFDPLTQLLNRSGFDETGQALLVKAQASKSGLSIFFVDLDGFKQVNDTYGHKAGDELLKLTAQRIRRALRSVDIIARQGGDEFLLMMESAPDAPHDEVVAQKILEAMKQPFQVDGQKVCVSVSIGISRWPQHGTTLTELVKKADQAMYAAKQKGRAVFVTYADPPITR